MSQQFTSALLWFSVLGCGLLAGVYFAFSGFVMTALSRVDPAAGIAAMNAINVVIVRSLFMPLFLGTTLAAAALAILSLFHWGESGTTVMLVGGIVYLLGMFLVTMIINVPLNNALAVADPDSAQAGAVWAGFLRDWTAWNHVRTLSSTVAMICFVVALAVPGGRTPGNAPPLTHSATVSSDTVPISHDRQSRNFMD